MQILLLLRDLHRIEVSLRGARRQTVDHRRTVHRVRRVAQARRARARAHTKLMAPNCLCIFAI